MKDGGYFEADDFYISIFSEFYFVFYLPVKPIWVEKLLYCNIVLVTCICSVSQAFSNI